MDNWTMKALILFVFISSLWAKPIHFLVVDKSLSPFSEQIALRLFDDRVELSMNSNRWTKINEIGLFEIKDKKIISELLERIASLKYRVETKVTYPSPHGDRVTIDRQGIPPLEKNYSRSLSLIKNIMKSYQWTPIDIVKLESKGRLISSKNKSVTVICEKKQFQQVCRSDYGVIYIK